MTQTSFCEDCNARHPESEFYTNSNGKPFKQCKEHKRARDKQWYQKNKAYVKKRNHEAYLRRKATA